MRRFLSMIVLALGLVLTACGGSGDENTGFDGVITWDRDPQTVVFRANTVGGSTDDAFLTRNDIPLCTIYGDNRIVWTNDLGDFNLQVLWDKLTDQQVQNFVSFVTVVERIYTYDARADQQPPSAVAPAYETMSVAVNGRPHTTDSFGEWEPEYFQRILETCKEISNAPVIYEPEGAWVTAQQIEYDTTRPSILWDGDAAGLKFTELAASSEARWITDSNLKILWNMIHTSSPIIQFAEGENAYEVVLEVPGVNPTAPAAP